VGEPFIRKYLLSIHCHASNVDNYWKLLNCDNILSTLYTELACPNPHLGQSGRMQLPLPKWETWSPPRLPKTQKTIWEVKSPRIGAFFMSLERSWSVDVQNGLVWAIWTFAAQVMGKRRAGSQIGSLTPDH
jgi:hypothetical protein